MGDYDDIHSNDKTDDEDDDLPHDGEEEEEDDDDDNTGKSSTERASASKPRPRRPVRKTVSFNPGTVVDNDNESLSKRKVVVSLPGMDGRRVTHRVAASHATELSLSQPMVQEPEPDLVNSASTLGEVADSSDRDRLVDEIKSKSRRPRGRNFAERLQYARSVSHAVSAFQTAAAPDTAAPHPTRFQAAVSEHYAATTHVSGDTLQDQGTAACPDPLFGLEPRSQRRGRSTGPCRTQQPAAEPAPRAHQFCRTAQVRPQRLERGVGHAAHTETRCLNPRTDGRTRRNGQPPDNTGHPTTH